MTSVPTVTIAHAPKGDQEMNDVTNGFDKMSMTMVNLVVAECKSACAEEPELEERLKKAMFVAKDHWMVTNDDMRFRGAVVAAYVDPLTTEEEKERITFTLDQLRTLGAMTSGVPVDLDRAFANPDKIQVVPLIKLWHEVKGNS